MVSIFTELLIFRIVGSKFVWNYIRDDDCEAQIILRFTLNALKRKGEAKVTFRETHLQNDFLDAEVVKVTGSG